MGFGVHVWCCHCRISPPHFLAECHKRRLNQGSFVLLFFRLYALFDLYLVFVCLFSCIVFVFSFCVSIFLYCFVCQVIGCEDRLQNDLYCVGWGFKLCSPLSAQSHEQHGRHAFTISSYTLAEQKVSEQQLIKVSLPWLYI